MYRLVFARKAKIQLDALPRPVSKRIVEKLETLSEDPFALDVKRLTGIPLYRLRVGDYRVIFDIQHDVLAILVVKIGHRKKIY